MFTRFNQLPEDNVEVVNICHLIEQLFGDKAWDWSRPYDETCKAVMDWAKANDAYYYARPREDFFIWEAVKLAGEAGKSKVIVEDMS